MKFQSLIVFILLNCCALFSMHAQVNFSVDIEKYELQIKIEDSSNTIYGQETIEFLQKSDISVIQLVNYQEKTGKGMHVDSILENGNPVKFQHSNNLISFASSKKSTKRTLTIFYHGIPIDGLIIGKNKFGNRTFFGDNWPNRAQHWFACNDHPLDKAKVDFTIIAPEKYDVVANGKHISSKLHKNGSKIHKFSSNYELPTKVIVFGAAEFEIEHLSQFTLFPLSSWVYPENKSEGFKDMEVAIEVLQFFSSILGEFPFEKLANVQSTTRYGGMENAGCIFYSENAITGKGHMEKLIAHEIAHQWFGNSASESDWDHLWLSEGFATYLTHLYIERKYGHEAYLKELQKDRITVRQFYSSKILPVVDTISSNPLAQLNANAYQRGSWILHMLRNKIGKENFMKGLQSYYTAFAYKNANTEDFIEYMEDATHIEDNPGIRLKSFYLQWLRTGEIPTLDLKWKLKGNRLNITVFQKQEKVFQFPLELKIYYENGTQEVIATKVDAKKITVQKKVKSKVNCIEFDPDVKLLFRTD